MQLTEMEQKSLKVQLELANEIISAQSSFMAHLRLAASEVFHKGTTALPLEVREFLTNLSDYNKNDRISSLCADYLKEGEMKSKILNKFK